MFVGPQQNSGPTEVGETGRVDLCRREACNEYLWEKVTHMVVNATVKTQKHSRISGGGRAGST